MSACFVLYFQFENFAEPFGKQCIIVEDMVRRVIEKDMKCKRLLDSLSAALESKVSEYMG